MPFGVNIEYRFFGFLENPNSYAYFSVFLLFLHISFYKKELFPNWLNLCGLALSSICIVGAGSRGASIALIFGFFVLIIRKMISIRYVIALAIAGVLPLLWFSLKGKLYMHFFNLAIWNGMDFSIQDRLVSSKLAFQWWLEQPLAGIGLGSFINRKIQTNLLPTTLHNTFIWLLTETGIIGLGLFLVFAFAALKSIYKSSLNPKNNELAIGGLAIFVTAAVASIGMEMMYQRYLWFILGMLLVEKSYQPIAENAIKHFRSDDFSVPEYALLREKL